MKIKEWGLAFTLWHPKLRHPWTRHIGLDSFVMFYHIQRKQKKFTVAYFYFIFFSFGEGTYMKMINIHKLWSDMGKTERGNKVGGGISWHWGLMFCEWRYCCCEIRNKVSAEVHGYRITKEKIKHVWE